VPGRRQFGSNFQCPWREDNLQRVSIICKGKFSRESYHNRLAWLQTGPSTPTARSRYRCGTQLVLLRISHGIGRSKKWSYSTADLGLDAREDLSRCSVLPRGSSSCFALRAFFLSEELSIERLASEPSVYFWRKSVQPL